MPESLKPQGTEQQLGPEQQYIQGPWKRISGATPLSDWELKILGPTFDLAYGAGNWGAHPVAPDERQRGGYGITVSPDAHSVYALVKRHMDEGGLGDRPAIQQGLQDLARKEAEGRLPSGDNDLLPPGNDIDGLPPRPQRN